MGILSSPDKANGAGEVEVPLVSKKVLVRRLETRVVLQPDKNAESRAGTLHPNPEEQCPLWWRWTFMYMVPTFVRGWKRPLVESDMFEPKQECQSAAATEELERLWNDEKVRAKTNGQEPSLSRAVFRHYWVRTVLLGMILLLEEVLHVVQPVCMGLLIRYFRCDAPLSKNTALFAAGGVAGTALISGVIHHPYFYGLQMLCMRLKVGASGIVMNKGVRLSSSAMRRVTIGHMINLLSTDIPKLDMIFLFFNYFWLGPILLFGYGYFIWREIGLWATLAGFTAIIVLLPIQGWASKMMGVTRREVTRRSDKRVGVMSEILNGVRVIKMYAWEAAFTQVIDQLRRHEMKAVRNQTIFQSIVFGLFWSCGKLTVLCAALALIWDVGFVTPEHIFVATALFNSCRLPVTLFFPFALQFLVECRVSLRRVQDFIELEDFGDVHAIEEHPGADVMIDEESRKSLLAHAPVNSTAPTLDIDTTPTASALLKLQDFSTVWDGDKDSSSRAINNVSFEAKPGQLIAVIGPVGCGKSSLLMSILRETNPVGGSLQVRGRIAYAAQDSWVFAGTVQQNVVFGLAVDEEKYSRALSASALHKDISTWPAGSMTKVGDRGTALSGGQKARIGLARALYADADIYLLDDPLSAVDASVGKHIFDRCIRSTLSDRIVLLATHQLQHLERADLVLLMKEGQVVASGKLNELRKSHADLFQQLIDETVESYRRRSESGTYDTADFTPQHPEHSPRRRLSSEKSESAIQQASTPAPAQPDTQNEEVRDAEERASGAVTWRTYGQYLKSGLFAIPTFLFVLLVQLLFNISDYWLSIWTTTYEKATQRGCKQLAANAGVPANMTTAELEEYVDSRTFFGIWHVDISLSLYQHLYTGLVLVIVVFSVVRCIWFRWLQVAASVTLHFRMFQAVVRAPLAFFDKNPIGRILNRFSKDVSTMDDQLSFVFFELLLGALNIFGLIGVILWLNPLVMAITVPVVIVFHFLRLTYISTSRSVKRLEATTRSPLYSHITATLNGVVTVRAFGRQNEILQRYHEAMNINSAAFWLTLSTSRWFAFCIDLLVFVFVAATAFFCVLAPDARSFSTGEVALQLVYAVQLTGFLSWIVRQSAEMQNGMVSVERILTYADLEPEQDDTQQFQQVDDTWPKEGAIRFDGVVLAYDDHVVLNSISMEIKPKEKIGIVGRTGAGKSSLLSVLFRLYPLTSGRVYIDNVPTDELNMKLLRRRISIIPQDPVLFMGTLRYNLDPFDEWTDDRIWEVIHHVELGAAVEAMPNKLAQNMQEGGTNLSVGQRQLVCLARAILRRSKICIIDEATANVDPFTDSLIQRTLAARFVDCTVLTIAHRIHTVIGSDRLMILDSGNLVEFDHAHRLLSDKPNGIFAKLIAETGRNQARQLKAMARRDWEKRFATTSAADEDAPSDEANNA